LGRWQAGEGEEPIAGFRRAIRDGPVLEPSLADEGFAARFDLFARTQRRFAGTRAFNFTKISVAGGNRSVPGSVFSA
jgi:hypothetical protein